MKKFLYIALIHLTLLSFGQTPQQMNYQAVARNTNGQPLLNGTPVSLMFIIHDGSVSGTPVYNETISTATNQFGLVNVQIGSTQNLGVVNWGNGAKYLQVEIDINNTGNFTSMGNSQLISVPYALFAGNSTAGPTGATGNMGVAGNNGMTGTTGPTGVQGQAGINGITGATGPTGATGAGVQGNTGVTGAMGIQGQPGINGTNGITGITGLTGATGAGIQGNTGVTGLTGPGGQTGPTGSNGLQGLIGSTGIAGATGTQGITGPSGTTGATGPTSNMGTGNGSNAATLIYTADGF